MRRAVCRSSLLKSRTAVRSISIFRAIMGHHVFKRHGLRFSGSQVKQPLLGEVQVFQVGQMLPNGLDHVEGLGASGGLGQC